jgi:GT2 family glycosyltransferase
MYPEVTIITINWNGWKDTLECLESLYQIDYPNYNILVIDNCSEDISIRKIRDYCEGNVPVKSAFLKAKAKKPIKLLESSKNEIDNLEYNLNFFKKSPSSKKLFLIKNEKNYGFAEGNNIGINFVLDHLNSDYILLLNNDTVVDENFLDELVKVGERTNEVGCVGPKVYYYDFKGRKDVISFAGEKVNLYTSRGKRFGHKQIDKGQYDVTMETDKVEGCCMLLKTDVIRKVGMFDPTYFAYWEETDLCMRIKNAGFKLLYVPEAKIWHKIGMNWDNYFSYFVIYHYLVRNRLIFIWRYASNVQKTIFSIYFFFYLMGNIVLMLVKEDRENFKDVFKAIKNGIKGFKEINSS